MFIWYILSGVGIMHQEKSGNPGWKGKLDDLTSRRFGSGFFFFFNGYSG
jgi:hypothetical protein